MILASVGAHFRGRAAEDWVAEQLIAGGWRVLARNFRAGLGELDLVVERSGALRFVEVKARQDADVDALEAVSADKQRRLRSAGEGWLAEHGLPQVEVAFLVVLVAVTAAGFSAEWWDDPF